MARQDENVSLFEDQDPDGGADLSEAAYEWQLTSPANVISRSPVRYQDTEFNFYLQRQLRRTAPRQAALFVRTARQAELEFERGRQGMHLYQKLTAEAAYRMQELEEFGASCDTSFSPDVALRVQAMVETGKNIMQMLPALGTRVYLSRYS